MADGTAWLGIDARKLGDTGIGRYVQILLAGLARQERARDFCWEVFSHAQRWQHLAEVPFGAVCRTVRSGVYSPLQHAEFLNMLRRHPLALFHAPHFTAPLLLPRSTRLAVTIHDVAFMERPDLVPVQGNRRWRLLLYHFLLHLVAWRADMVFVDTTAAGEVIARHLPGACGKIHVLSPGIDVARLQAAGDRGHAPRNTLLFVGTVTERKGIRALLRAFAASRASREGMRLVLAGSNTSAYAERAVRLVSDLSLAGQVTFAGPVSDDELLRLYASAHVVVLPSLLEGFGLPVVEAMAARVPCVASALPEIVEVAGDAALLVPTGDLPALAAGLDRACFDRAAREALITRGEQRAAMYSAERMGADALRLYREMLS